MGWLLLCRPVDRNVSPSRPAFVAQLVVAQLVCRPVDWWPDLCTERKVWTLTRSSETERCMMTPLTLMRILAMTAVYAYFRSRDCVHVTAVCVHAVTSSISGSAHASAAAARIGGAVTEYTRGTCTPTNLWSVPVWVQGIRLGKCML